MRLKNIFKTRKEYSGPAEAHSYLLGKKLENGKKTIPQAPLGVELNVTGRTLSDYNIPKARS
jgi:hypothetical protein